MALNSSRRRDMLQLAAYRQSRERQQGVNCSEGYLSVAGDIGITGNALSVVSVFRAPEPNGKVQYVTTLVRDNHRYSLWMETQGHFYCGTGGGSQSLHLGDLTPGSDHLVALCRDEDTLYCYLDGELKGTLGVYDFTAADGFFIGRAAINQDSLFTSTIYSTRVFDYTLSAEEVAALYNNGDPAGYVLPKTMKRPSVIFPTGIYTPSNAVFNTTSGSVTTTSYDQPRANGFGGDFMRFDAIAFLSLYCRYMVGYLRQAVPIRITCEYRSNTAIYSSQIDPSIASADARKVADANEGDPIIVSVIYGTGPNYYLFSASNTPDAWLEMRILSIESVGCVAEYLPQNLIVASKQDFPQVVFPNGRYTPSKGTYTFNNSTTTTALWDQPQANGFSGPFMRFEAITAVSIYNDYWSTYLKGVVPVVVTAEYRSTKPLYHRTGISSKYIFIADANEGDAKIITIMVPDYTGSSRLSFADAPVTANDWLELRVLSIEVAESAVPSWLDSAKQLPLNDEYLPPLLETAGGYDLTTNGAPGIVYKMTQCAYIIPDLMDDGTGHSNPYIGLYFNNDQPDATYSRVNDKIVANIGSYSSPTNRPMVTYYRFNFIPGRYYRISVKWTLISGSYFLEAFRNWSTDSYEYTGDSLHTEPGSYEYTTPLLKAGDVMTNSYRPTFFFGTRQAHSEFSIDEIIIEGYE